MLLYGASTHSWKADPDYRDSLQKILYQEGSEVLYKKLMQVDPVSAATLDHRNTHYVTSALEYYHATGMSKSLSYQEERIPRLNAFFVTPYKDDPMNRNELYRKIDTRVAEMFRLGLLEEYDLMTRQF